MPDAILSHRSVVKNEYQLLADITVGGSAVTQVDISGLNIGRGDEIVLVSTIINPLGVNYNPLIYVNGNYTNTSYYCQYIEALATTINAGRANSPLLSVVWLNANAFNTTSIKITNSRYFEYQNKGSINLGSNVHSLLDIYGTSTFKVTSITSLRILAGSTNGIGIGSRFQLYKVGG